MKKFFPPSALMFSLCILTLGLSFSFFLFSRENMSGTAIAAFERGAQNPTCLDNWQEWPTSQEANHNAEWSLEEFPIPPRGWYNDDRAGTYYSRDRVMSQFIDMNGDGLQDYIYSYRDTVENSINFTEDCVLLNTGSGWRTAYKCRASYDPEQRGTLRYWGDCALVE